MSGLTPPRLAEIAARRDAASPGPWEPYFTTHGDPYVAQAGRPKFGVIVSTAPDDYGRADAEFIAHAHADVGDLLAEIDRLKAEATFAFARRDECYARVEALTAETLEQASQIEHLRTALEGKVWEPTLEAALRDAMRRCGSTNNELAFCNSFKPCRGCLGALALLDRLGPQEPA